MERSGQDDAHCQLIPELNRRGLSVSTIKHAHHNFDLDQPGKDSYEHRAAGAEEVLVASANRVALMRELRGAPEPSLDELLRLLKDVDLVLVEGFKRDALPEDRDLSRRQRQTAALSRRPEHCRVDQRRRAVRRTAARVDRRHRGRGGSCARACSSRWLMFSPSLRSGLERLTFAALRASFDDATMAPLMEHKTDR